MNPLIDLVTHITGEVLIRIGEALRGQTDEHDAAQQEIHVHVHMKDIEDAIAKTRLQSARDTFRRK